MMTGMSIRYDKLGEEGRGLIDALEIIKTVGEDKHSCLLRIEEDLEDTDNTLAETPCHEDDSINKLLDYRTRLTNARRFIQNFFIQTSWSNQGNPCSRNPAA